MTAPRFLDAPVAGGALRVAHWGAPVGDAPVVIAAHGITASHLNWVRVAEVLGDDVALLAPDLRGRGASNALPGPYTYDVLGEDLVAVLDHVGVERALFAGHSMGGFVVALATARHADRALGTLLIDGGLALGPLPEGVDIDVVLQAVIGPALDRLKTTFPSREAYRDFWRAHPALTADWDEQLEAYVDYDLVGEEPDLRSRCSIEAVREGARDSLVNDELAQAPARMARPALLLRAAKGMLGQAPPLYADEVLAPQLQALPFLQVETVPDVNHYTITMGKPGAAVVADHIRALVAS